ncbi:MAG: hypothetical protein QGD90_05585 [Candidatus Hydrogenedentes bacterium]|nr:hypothetical protein [Candidatus Hydrogenedentota bacterium]
MKTAQTGERVLVSMLALSLLFHLSAVTLFRIVIYFPRYDIEYFDVVIVDAGVPMRPLAIPQERLVLGIPGGGLDKLEAEREPLEIDDTWSRLPDIQLPTVRFEELGRLRLRRQGLETRSRYKELFEDTPDDAWSRFGRRLTSVSESLTRFTQGSAAEPTRRPVPVSRPAPGFEAYLEWLSEPRDRQALWVHPIDALWGLDPAEFGEPIILVFRVDRAGKVLDVLDPVEDVDSILQASVEALKRYRFEPLLGEGPSIQHGTLIIRANGERR